MTKSRNFRAFLDLDNAPERDEELPGPNGPQLLVAVAKGHGEQEQVLFEARRADTPDVSATPENPAIAEVPLPPSE